MKVFWITNSPSGAAATLGRGDKVNRGWIDSLERKLSATGALELSVAFPWLVGEVQSFQQDGITYWAIPRTVPPRGFPRWWRRIRHDVDDPQVLAHLRRIIGETAPDIVQIWGTEDGYGLLIPSLAPPTVIHIQGNLTVYTKKRFSGVSFMDTVRTTRPLDFLRGWGPLHDYYEVVHAAEREAKVFRSCRYFMGRTDWDRRIAAVMAPHAAYYHCDELLREPFWEKVWQPHTRDQLVLCTTIMGAPYKGLETVCECAQLLRRAGVEGFEWRVVGLTPGEDVVRTVERTRGIGLSSVNVRILGRKSADELVGELLNADVYVHPSHIENSANSICEAMLLGMPVIATYAGGTPSLVSDGRDGLMVQDGDPYALAGAVMELTADRERARQLGRNARARAEVRHDPDRVVKTLVGIYQDIIAMESSARPPRQREARGEPAVQRSQ